ncbi:MAG: hypothetical protein Q7T55_24800 [Solirubrobacteraceae bacterium]|nr:hypothetical protein [Solirubrobacteraceae bacterium]
MSRQHRMARWASGRSGGVDLLMVRGIRTSRAAMILVAGLAIGGVMGPAAARATTSAKPSPKKRPPSYGNATITSVDGPGRLTLRTTGGPLKVRLWMVDTPEPGECGAEESTAALQRLTKGRRARVRYGMWRRRADGEGRVAAFVGPRRADFTKDSLSRDLIATEWARTAPAVTVSEGDGIYLSVGSESPAPPSPEGCGLPAAAGCISLLAAPCPRMRRRRGSWMPTASPRRSVRSPCLASRRPPPR